MDMETVRDQFDPLSLEIALADEGQCGHSGDDGRCPEMAELSVHFHIEHSPFATECIILPGCRAHVLPVWEGLWLRTPDAN